MLIKKKRENSFLPEINCAMFEDIGDMHKVSGICEHALRNDRVDMRMPVYKIAKGLDSPDHGGNAGVAVDLQPKHIAYRIVCRTAELAKQTPVVPEVNPQPFWNSKNPLPMGTFRENLSIESMSKQQSTLLVA
jgi:hypothetical protein